MPSVSVLGARKKMEKKLDVASMGMGDGQQGYVRNKVQIVELKTLNEME